MAVADVVAQRSPCSRAKVGAVIVDASNRIVATGYNGAPAKLAIRTSKPQPFNRRLLVGDCTEWCPHSTADEPSPCYDDCFSIHAEANALMFCDRREREGGALFVTSNPCWTCAKQVANSGLAAVWFRVDAAYREPKKVRDFLADCGLKAYVWTD